MMTDNISSHKMQLLWYPLQKHFKCHKKKQKWLFVSCFWIVECENNLTHSEKTLLVHGEHYTQTEVGSGN